MSLTESGTWNAIVEVNHTSPPGTCCFSPDGLRLATTFWEGRMSIYYLSRNQWMEEKTYHHDNALRTATFGSDSTQLITKTSNAVRIFKLTKAGQWKIGNQWQKGEWLLIRKFSFAKWVETICFSPCRKHLIIAVDDEKTRVYNKDFGWSMMQVINNQNKVYCTIFNPKGNRFVIGREDGTVTIMIFGKQANWVQEHESQHNGSVYSVCFNHNGRLLATASADKTSRLMALDRDDNWVIQTTICHYDQVLSAIFSPDMRSIATVSRSVKKKVHQHSYRFADGCTVRIYRLIANSQDQDIATNVASLTI